MKRYWVSWYFDCAADGPFELHSPWWITGWDGRGRATVCAAIIADSEDDARRAVREGYDSPPDDLEWRFVDQRDSDWSPFGDRFKRADWMQWP